MTLSRKHESRHSHHLTPKPPHHRPSSTISMHRHPLTFFDPTIAKYHHVRRTTEGCNAQAWPRVRKWKESESRVDRQAGEELASQASPSLPILQPSQTKARPKASPIHKFLLEILIETLLLLGWRSWCLVFIRQRSFCCIGNLRIVGRGGVAVRYLRHSLLLFCVLPISMLELGNLTR